MPSSDFRSTNLPSTPAHPGPHLCGPPPSRRPSVQDDSGGIGGGRGGPAETDDIAFAGPHRFCHGAARPEAAGDGERGRPRQSHAPCGRIPGSRPRRALVLSAALPIIAGRLVAATADLDEVEAFARAECGQHTARTRPRRTHTRWKSAEFSLRPTAKRRRDARPDAPHDLHQKAHPPLAGRRPSRHRARLDSGDRNCATR